MFTRFLIKAITFFIYLLISFTYSQKKVVEEGAKTIKIDLDKGIVSEKFPFDEYINLKITSKKNKIVDSIAIFEVVYVKGYKVLNDNDLKKNVRRKKVGKKLNKIDKEIKNVSYVKLKLDESLPHIYEGRINPLNPDKIYELVFTNNLNDKKIDVFYKVVKLLTNGEESKAKELFNSKIKSLDINTHNFVVKKTMSSFKYLKDSIVQKVNSVYSNLNNLKYRPDSISKSDIEKFINMLNAKKIPISEFSKTMFTYLNIGDVNCDEIFQGIRVIGSDEKVDIKDYSIRTKNIRKNYIIIKKLDNQFKTLISYHASDSSVQLFYNKTILEMKKSFKFNDSIAQFNSKKAKKLINKYFSYGSVVTNGTISNQNGKNGLAYLVPDIGYINAFGKNQTNQIEYIGRTYLGLNWHFTGYNKNKKISQLAQKRFWAYCSLSIGITFGSVNEGGYQDLFENFSPLVGMNIRLAKNVRLGGGFLLTRYDRNPILNKESLAPLPYFSISFDDKFFKDFTLFNRIFK